MKTQKISFGRDYSLQTKKGESISKEDADKVVKRNMLLANGVPPTLLTALFLPFIKNKSPKNLMGLFGSAAFFGGLFTLFANDEYKSYHKQKDGAPERFYKWGGFKVIYK